MKTIKKLEEFIKLKAKEHQESDPNNDSPYEYEMIEQDTFTEIAKFFINEGVKPEGIDYDIFFNGIDYDVEDVDEEFDDIEPGDKSDRVTFEYKAGDELVEKVEKFYQILIKQGILNTEVDDELLNMFRL